MNCSNRAQLIPEERTRIPLHTAMEQNHTWYCDTRQRNTTAVCKQLLSKGFRAKRSDKAKYLEYVTYVLAHVPELYQFYGIQDGKLKYFKYKSKQKAISEAVNILVNGGKKYRKIKNGHTKRNRRRKRRKKERSNEYIRC